jgi:hypothetical protein
MRKISLFAASMAVLPWISQAHAEDNARIYYKDGTRIETQDFDMKINLKVQPRFTFSDKDEGGRRDAGLDSAQDTTGFDVRRVEVSFAGNLLDKQFSYKLKTDLRADGGGSSLRDAWLQWNSDGDKAGHHLMWGQFKVPFSRQELDADEAMEFIDRSVTSDYFSPSRHMGAMVHGQVSDDVNYYLETFNGESTDEGINKPPVDNNLAVAAALTANIGDYGSRGYEGDLREDNSSTAFTTGIAAIYGEGEGDVLDIGSSNDFERFDLNVDGGVRSNGFSAQSEFYYSHIELDDLSGDEGEADLFGFYIQGGYMLDRQWEVAARFAYVAPDEDVSEIDDINEYNLVLNYYINGHNLKVQSGVTWLVTNFNGDVSGDDLTDFRYEMQLAGYF